MTTQALTVTDAPKFAPTLSEEDAKQQARLLKALSDGTRLLIITLLSDVARQHQEIHGEEVAEALGRKQPGISRHLTILEKAGVVETRPNGMYKCYSINRAALRKAISIIELAGDLYE